jgi:4-hydroxy-3-polyprenylbenzoate decarboxylase
VRRLIGVQGDPLAAAETLRQRRTAAPLWHMLPRGVRRAGVARQTSIGELPQFWSWPGDGGPFITLPQVYTEDVEHPGLRHSNLGMYRVQLGGGQYRANEEVGLHYQIHRGIGIHHAAAIRRGEPLRVNIFVGSRKDVAAVMPLPEGMSELGFAGVLAGHRMP